MPDDFLMPDDFTLHNLPDNFLCLMPVDYFTLPNTPVHQIADLSFCLLYREAEEDYEFRRQELVGNFDEMMRKREQEYQRKLDETSGLLLANDLKVSVVYS